MWAIGRSLENMAYYNNFSSWSYPLDKIHKNVIVMQRIMYLFFSKGKVYDGSGMLRMIGCDCKKMEDDIDKFLVYFLQAGEPGKAAHRKDATYESVVHRIQRSSETQKKQKHLMTGIPEITQQNHVYL